MNNILPHWHMYRPFSLDSIFAETKIFLKPPPCSSALLLFLFHHHHKWWERLKITGSRSARHISSSKSLSRRVVTAQNLTISKPSKRPAQEKRYEHNGQAPIQSSKAQTCILQKKVSQRPYFCIVVQDSCVWISSLGWAWYAHSYKNE